MIKFSTDISHFFNFFYPGACALNIRKKIRVKHAGSFDSNGLTEFSRNLAAGRGGRNMQAFTENQMPTIKVTDEWDGQDASPPVEDDIDLDDFDWGDDEEEDNAKDEL